MKQTIGTSKQGPLATIEDHFFKPRKGLFGRIVFHREHKALRICKFIFSFFLLPIFAQAQPLSLQDCYRLTRANAPQIKLLALNAEELTVGTNKLESTNMPTLKAYGSASYQSEAVRVVFPIPGVEPFELDLFQYNTGVIIDQKIYDGSMVGLQKDIKTIQASIQDLESELAIYQLNELVNKYFFGVAMLQKSIRILELKIEVLNQQEQNLQSGVRQGLITESESGRLAAERLTAGQQLIETNLSFIRLKESLGMLVGYSGSELEIVLPDSLEVPDSLNRLEYSLFDERRNYFDATSKLYDRQYLPRLNAFGQTGYSYPGLNMFENASDYYYIVGVKLGWNLFDWNQAKKEKQLLTIQKSRIDIAEQDFDRNINLALKVCMQEIESLKTMLKSDEEIVKYKENIRHTSASMLQHGTITPADYLRDLNEELHARFVLEQHQIKLIEAQAMLAYYYGIPSIN